jgi:serine/threonine protein phosphatase PrpC
MLIGISIVCEAASTEGRVNEDACYVASDSIESLAVAIDGASQRIELPILQQLIKKTDLPEGTTAAALVAQHTRDFIKDNPQLSPFDLISKANQAWREQLETLINPLTAENIARLLPQHSAMLNDDPRLLRLTLPACVLTVAKINHAKHTLSFAHAGDTALFAFYKNGDVQQITGDQMGFHDQQALDIALNIKAETGAKHLSEVLKNPRVTKQNVGNGIYHNYVDEHGKTDNSLGVGVVDGLHELDAYIEVGKLDIEPLEGVLLCSDGIPLPGLVDETQIQAQERLQTMKNIIMEEGLDQYLTHLRQIEVQDKHLDRFPRFKIHDDATAILLRFA